MSIIVQKFGGTSVADSEKILAAARKAIRAQQEGHQVVMVVSAMGKNTDLLVSLAAEITDRPSAREMDMLLSTGEQVSVALMAMAIQSLGHQAISLTGAQIGIKTDSTHRKARILSISTDRVGQLLNEGNIVIAAGFQGIDDDFNITTLGRGGSDTTAVALAAVLGAVACEIHTDVDGVYTTDPRVLPEARRVSCISYDEMFELASLGAGVMHSRSIEFAKKFNVPIHVRSSFSDIPGTMIVGWPESDEQTVSGCTLTRGEARVSVFGVPDTPGTSMTIFSGLMEHNISIDMIVQNVGQEGKADVSFTVLKEDLPSALEVVEHVASRLGALEFSYDDNVSKVSAVGLGMARRTGVADRMFQALAESGVNILMITTSEIKISVLVAREDAQEALRVVHHVFELDQQPEITPRAETATPPRTDAVDVVARLQGMEELTVEDVSLDETQARVTIAGVPDRPGVAAAVFQEIAGSDVFVDMIVQSFGNDGLAALSFTVPQTELTKALEVAQKLAQQFGCSAVSSSAKVAKLSVSGIGMRSHANVAIRMFDSLAEQGINVEMINTSEVRVNVIVDGEKGQAALTCLQATFADVLG